MNSPNSINWFEEGFGKEYLTVYQHRDESEAHVLANLIRSRVRCAEGSPALDVACGAGRHRRFLGNHQWVVGIDLSSALLRIARGMDQGALLVRADMRALPFRSGTFALVVNLFTSFGYFNDDSQHQLVVAEIARVTAPGGWFVLDFLNARYVRRTLVPFDQRQIGSLLVVQKREISTDGRYVHKSIKMIGTDRIFHERVRLFDLKDLTSMLQACGFTITEALGDYQGGPVTTGSPRVILVGRRL